ncbi:MAG: hypothetical protein E6R05_02600 [Candidatus Moraniibacteriota bacterium]|nr:MAG: hypothetical protein E6R05_02600 [Candidatus Moranbacteria bacterium]
MKVPRFWHREWVRVPARDGSTGTWSIPRWGWSENNSEEAERMAAERCWQTKQRWNQSADFSNSWYHNQEYFAVPAREEIVQEIANEEGSIDGWVSRNGYGVLVLNTDVMLIIDMDRKETPMRKAAKGLWSSWFGTPIKSEEEKLIELFKANQQDSFRLYRTFAGWRAILISRAVEGVTPSCVELMKKFPVDPFYLRLCERQKSYRARLTAKPWRIGVPRCDIDFPRSSHMDEYFSRWEQEYNAAATKFRACEKIYGEEGACERLQNLLAIHDSLSQVHSALPLA